MSIFSAEETIKVIRVTGSLIVDDVGGSSTVVTSTIEGVRIVDDDHRHLIPAENLLQVAMT